MRGRRTLTGRPSPWVDLILGVVNVPRSRDVSLSRLAAFFRVRAQYRLERSG